MRRLPIILTALAFLAVLAPLALAAIAAAAYGLNQRSKAA
jgi:multidrug efflux pump subunit AcrB